MTNIILPVAPQVVKAILHSQLCRGLDCKTRGPGITRKIGNPSAEKRNTLMSQLRKFLFIPFDLIELEINTSFRDLILVQIFLALS